MASSDGASEKRGRVSFGQEVRARVDGRTLDAQRDTVDAKSLGTAAEVRAAWDAHHDAVAAARRRENIAIELKNDERVGICCSGGGIRSAAFNLGALQALQRKGRLHTADFLAAVSGGAYTAGAMSILQMPFVQPDPSSETRDVEPGDAFDTVRPFQLGSPEERYLRRHSSYLASGPRGRLRLAGYLLLGALLQMVAVVGVLAIVALPLAWLGLRLTPQLGDDLTIWADAVPLLIAIGVGLLVVGLLVASWSIGRRGADLRGAASRRVAVWLGGLGTLVLLIVAGLPGFVATALRVADEFSAASGADALTRLLVAMTAAGVPTVIVSAIRLIGKQLTGKPEAGGADGTKKRRIPEWSSWAAYVVTPLVIAVIFVLLYVLGVRIGPTGIGLAWIAAAVVLAGFYLAIDPNMSSMHTFYRERLADAFALQRVRQEPQGPLEAMERPYHAPTTLSQTRQELERDGRMWPRLLVCAAVNVSVPGATPTGRNALPLVFSDDWIGGDDIGWVNTKDYEAALAPPARTQNPDDGAQHTEDDSHGARNGYPMGRGQAWLATLLASMAVSGAALSPSMGKMTSRPYRFLLGLVNARLGIWLPNPRFTAEPGSLNRRPWLSWQLRELVGNIDMDRDFIYVSDGGHYENLGLVELLRRRCTEIWCFDASGDEPDSFVTLAQALAMARTDLGIDITELRPSTLREGTGTTPPPAERVLADSSVLVSDFTYQEPNSQPVQARLIYVKCRVTVDAPWDVTSLYERDAQFPNHSTADQLYGEERFEAYRKLGDHLATHAYTRFTDTTKGHVHHPETSVGDGRPPAQPPPADATT